MPVYVSGRSVQASGVWTVSELLRRVVPFAGGADAFCVWFRSAPVVPELTAFQRAFFRFIGRFSRCACRVEISGGGATISRLIELLECMHARDVTVFDEPYDAPAMRALLVALPNTNFKGGIPAALLVHLKAPSQLSACFCETYAGTPQRAQVARLCTTSVRLLRVERFDRPHGASWETLVCILKSAECSLTEVRLHKSSDFNARDVEQLCNTPRFVRVIQMSPTKDPKLVVEEEQWGAWQEKKKALHVFFSAASVNNERATPHAFARDCGKDVRRIIMNCVMSFA